MDGRKYGYARVSTSEQNLDRQLIALTNAGIAARDIFTDKLSGKNFDRPQYQLLRDQILREGDELFIKSLDRLGRNKSQTLEELRHFKEAGVVVRILDLPTTLIDLEGNDWVMEMINNIIIEVYASIAENERMTIRQRQREGIDAAKAAGRQLGRNRIEYPENWQQVYGIWDTGKISAVDAMKVLGLKRSTFYKLVKEWRHDKTQGG